MSTITVNEIGSHDDNVVVNGTFRVGKAGTVERLVDEAWVPFGEGAAAVQSNLTTHAGLTSGTHGISAFGATLVDDANATAARGTLGLGTIATQAANSVSITGGSVTGIADITVADGGTGASDAATARTNLVAAALRPAQVGIAGTTHTFTTANEGQIVASQSASHTQFNIPPDSAQAFPIGAVVRIRRHGAGTLAIYADSGVLLNGVDGGGKRIPAQWGWATIRKTATDAWEIVGTLSEIIPATYTVTTTGAETHTITSFGVSSSTVVDWGDGSDDTYTGTALRTHAYASAGTWTVTIAAPLNVTEFDMRDSKVTLNSANIAGMANITTFIATGLRNDGAFSSTHVSDWRPTNFLLYTMPSGYGGTWNSADVSDWMPSAFILHSMPAGYAGTWNSADVSDWRPTSFYLNSMPSGYAGTFASADVSDWRPATFYLDSMPSGYAFNIAATGFTQWTTTSNFQMHGNALSQAQVNAILWQLYQASATPRTATSGTINLGGTNAAPSGTFQAAAACPVTVATDGKETAHELLNDGCASGFNAWTTVTITA